MFYEIGFVGFKSFCLNASVRDLNVIICAISHKRNIFFEAPEAMGSRACKLAANDRRFGPEVICGLSICTLTHGGETHIRT